MADTLMTNVLAGMAGGFASVYVGQPLDTVKVKMQLFPNMYKSMFSCVMTIARQQGLRGLYAGTVPALASSVAENAVMFGTYGQCQRLVTTVTRGSGGSTTDLTYLENATAGSIASIFTSLVLCPTELVKIRMQGGADGKPKRGPRLSQVVKNIWKVDGFKGLFRGMGSTMARECISCPVFFGAYEWARERLKPAGGRKEDCSPAATMASGSAAGLLMWLTVYPIDVIKSRLQMSTGNGNRLRSVADEIRSAGVRGLFCGLWPTLVKSVPVTGVLLFGVEFSKPVFRKYLFRNASAPERPDGDGDERPTDGIFSFCDFVSGWTAGIISTCVGHPMDTVRVVQQVTDSTASKASREIYKQDKFSGYFRGMMFPILSSGVINSIFFGVNGNVMRYIQTYRNSDTKENIDVRFCCDCDNLNPYWHLDVFVSGCTAGLFCTSINIPIEVIKTMLQVSKVAPTLNADNTRDKNNAQPTKANSPKKLIAEQYKAYGIRSFYRGGTLLMLRDVPSMGVYMLSYEHFCCMLKKLSYSEKNEESMPIHVQIIAGGLAGILSWVTVLPFDVIKSKIIADSLTEPQYKGAWDCVRKTYNEGGTMHFFRGFWLLCLRAFPVNGITFLVYEMLLKTCADQQTVESSSLVAHNLTRSRWS